MDVPTSAVKESTEILIYSRQKIFPGQIINGNCSFCMLNNVQNRESYAHFFLNCPTVCNFMQTYFNDFLQSKDFDWEQDMALIGTKSDVGKNDQMICNIEIITVIYYVNSCRVKNIQPTIIDLKQLVQNYREIFSLASRYKRAWLKWRGGNENPLQNVQNDI